MKQCSVCKLNKSESDFHWANKSKGKRKSTCIPCRSSAKPKEWESGGRTCNSCSEYKELSLFNKRTNGTYSAVCKLCVKKKRAAKEHPDLDTSVTRVCNDCLVEKTIVEFPANKNSALGRLNICKSCYSIRVSVRNYNLSREDLQAILLSQDNKCKICRDEFTDVNKYHIDHDHKCCPGNKSCGQCVRGLLCRSCNHGLGNFRDSIDSLTRAIKYLQK